MATKKATTKKTVKRGGKAKSVAAKVKAPSKKEASSKEATLANEFRDLDRKGLAAKARQLKKELLAIRFNVTSPSLTEYRKKRRALARVLSHLN